MVHFTLRFILLLVFSSVASASGESEALRQQLDALKQQMLEIQQTYEQKILELEQRLVELEKEPQRESAKVSEQGARPTQSVADSTVGTPVQIGVSGLFAAGGSSANNDELENLQAGSHDPNQNGFTVQQVEVSIGGTVDPYFDAQAYVIFQIDNDGETEVELEEAYFTTRNLPWGLQLKGGQYFTEFGRHNPQHPHVWAFADQPVILSRLFGGDGLRSQGLRASWLLPAKWYSELQFGLQNSKGETAVSFLGEDGEEIGGHVLLDRDVRNFSDLLYSARWLNGFDATDQLSMNLGVSALYGPNATGSDTDTIIIGADSYLKWQPAYTQRGFPFVSWHTEILGRRYEGGDTGDPDREILKDWGLFTQAIWGYRPGWVAGLRMEYATGDGDNDNDPLRDSRKRLSPNLTWYPTEFSKLRLQYNRDWTEHLSGDTADSLWLQMEFSLGSHMAHTF